MRTITTNGRYCADAMAGGPRTGIFGGLLESRMLRANAHVRDHVVRLSDRALREYGLTAGEVAALRATGRRRAGPAQ